MTDAGSRIRVLIVDDHTLFREGLSEMLATQAAIDIVGEARNGAEAIVLAQDKKPDVVLLDVEMPIMGGDESMGKIFEASPSSKVVILTMHDNPRMVRELVAQGASAYVVKSANRQELISAVRSAAQDEEGVALSISQRTLDALEGRTRGPLSDREMEILLHVARGMSNTQIASRLKLSEGTVKRHLANIYNKLEVGSRSEAIRIALSEGWITSRDVGRAN